MKSKLIIAVLALMLQGCFYQTVTAYDIQRADKFCEDKGGVFSITASFLGLETAYCNDGTKVESLAKVKL